jgi:hypothetical protein
MSLQAHLMASLRQLVLDHLPYDRQDAAAVRDLHQMTPSQLLIRWLNWTRRMVPPQPRQVLLSREFLDNPILAQRKADIQAFISDIESGADLTKYLSRRVAHGYLNLNRKKTHQRADLDLMLSAWGIHHLHFSQIVDADGFVKRDGPIIFAVFRLDRAYLIDIMTHKDWTRTHVIRVLVNNWPNAGLVHEMKGTLALDRTISDDKRQQLRNAQVNSPIVEIDGKVYMPAAGMTMSGVAINNVRQADQILDALNNFSLMYERNPQEIISEVTHAGITWPDEPDFVVEFRPDGYGVTEMNSGTFLKLGP